MRKEIPNQERQKGSDKTLPQSNANAGPVGVNGILGLSLQVSYSNLLIRYYLQPTWGSQLSYLCPLSRSDTQDS